MDINGTNRDETVQFWSIFLTSRNLNVWNSLSESVILIAWVHLKGLLEMFILVMFTCRPTDKIIYQYLD